MLRRCAEFHANVYRDAVEKEAGFDPRKSVRSWRNWSNLGTLLQWLGLEVKTMSVLGGATLGRDLLVSPWEK